MQKDNELQNYTNYTAIWIWPMLRELCHYCNLILNSWKSVSKFVSWKHPAEAPTKPNWSVLEVRRPPNSTDHCFGETHTESDRLFGWDPTPQTRKPAPQTAPAFCIFLPHFSTSLGFPALRIGHKCTQAKTMRHDLGSFSNRKCMFSY